MQSKKFNNDSSINHGTGADRSIPKKPLGALGNEALINMKIDRRNRVNLCKSDYQRSSYLDTVMITASFGKEPGYGTGILLKD